MPCHSPTRFGVCLLLMLVPDCSILAQTPPAKRGPDDAVARLTKVRGFRETALAPDGKRVAWVESLQGKDGAASPHSAIFVANLATDSSNPHRVTAGTGPCTEHSPAWSPDGTRLAFLSDTVQPGQLQLYVTASGKPMRLTALRGFLADPRWSPDGKQLAFLFTENAPQVGPIGPGAVETGEIGETVHYQRLTIVDLESGKFRQVSPAGLYVYEYDWAPDSKRCVLCAAHGSGDNNWYLAQLFSLTTASGECTSILKPAMQIAVPRWSPDGKTIAFIGGLMSDQGVNGGDICTVPADGGKPVNRTPNLDSSASWLTWHPSSRQIVFAEHIDGGSGIGRVDFAGGVTHLWNGAETISAEGGAHGASISRDGQTFALIRQSFDRPPEVWAGQVGAWQAITDANRRIRPAWGKTENLHWQSDAFRIQGWLLYPDDFDPKRTYPLAVQVHGGPAGAATPRWQHEFSVTGALSRRGYFVFLPNPRGSHGQGEKFTRANVKDLGHGDLRDILTGVDEVLRIAPVDKDRLGIGGWSYGGYMTMWAVTQTDRFRAAVSGAGIANWQSYYGQNGIDQWLIPYFGASVYDDPAIYARSSPIEFIKRVKTPTLVLVGERDVECPMPQSQEFYRALKTLKVPTRLVVYPARATASPNPSTAATLCGAGWNGSTRNSWQKHLGQKNKSIHSYIFAPDVFALGAAMPISLSFPIRRLSQAEFGDISFEVMRHVFAIHNDLGRFFDEKFYKRVLAHRLPNVRLEVPIDITFDSFQKRCFIDVLVGDGGVFEFKAAVSLSGRHRAQLLQYLLLSGLAHGKLINVRPEDVQHEFVNTHWHHSDRVQFEVETTRCNKALDGISQLCDVLTAVLRDLGTGLEVVLYEEAVAHFFGGADNVETDVAVEIDGRRIGCQRFRLIAPGVALKITGFDRAPDSFEIHARRLLAHAALRAIAWVNVNMTTVTFTTLER